MEAASVTSRTRAQIERVERDIAEARSRTIAAKEPTRRPRLLADRGPSGSPLPLEEQPCLD